MIEEHDRIVLTVPVPTEGLEVGDVGTGVHVYADGLAFEIEFTTLDGTTAALAVSAKYVVHPERSEKNGVATQPFSSEEAPDDAPS